MAATIPATSQTKDIRKFITATSVGTLIEWYDFYIYGSLATVIAGQFFPRSNPSVALLLTLAIFAAGFIVRPLGASFFGRLGNPAARKFPLTLLLLGGSTFAMGLIPGYQTIGIAAPLIVLLLRLLQGLALGVEYDGATTFVAQEAPANRRGVYTSWIQLAPTLGLLMGLGVILVIRHGLDADRSLSIQKFEDWGWRIPFLLSIVLVLISIYIRLRMQGSPLFEQLKTKSRPAGPSQKSVGSKPNLKIVLLVLFGATMGQGVIFYTGQFYTQFFMENVCHLDFDQSMTMLLVGIALVTPFFIRFGALSDRNRLGRKWLMLGGMLLAIVTYPFLFQKLLTVTSTNGRTELTAQKEILSTVAFIGRSKDMMRTSSTISHYDGDLVVTESKTDTVYAGGRTSAKSVITTSRKVGTEDFLKITAILFLLVFCAAMVCGPIAAYLAELFPSHTRYASMSLSDQLGNGILGGVTPFMAMLLTINYSGNPLAGLWFPIGIAAIALVIGALYLPSKPQP